MLTQKRAYTRDDLLDLPDDWRVELVDGDLVMAPSPIAWHQLLVTRLSLRLGEYLAPNDQDRLLTAPLDVSVDTHNVNQPDLMVLDAGVWGEGLAWEIPTPVWVAEVISPYTARHDLLTRKQKHALHRPCACLETRAPHQHVVHAGRRWTFLAIIFPGFPIGPAKPKHRCNDCGHTWRE